MTSRNITYAEGRQRMRPYRKCHWTTAEDALLTTFVQAFGAGGWDFIARHIEGRSAKSCRLRWVNHLSPNVNKAPFTEEEKLKLLHLHKEVGNRWSLIVKHFRGRTDNQLKNKFNVLMGGRKRTMGASGSDSRVPLKGGPTGNHCPGFNPFSSAAMNAQASPLISTGSASGHVKGGTVNKLSCPIGSNRLKIYYCHMTSHGNPIMSDANSVASHGICVPVAQPQQEAGHKEPQFFDFMGVGTSV